jgi:uncharacterized protein (TIGR02001 family)
MKGAQMFKKMIVAGAVAAAMGAGAVNTANAAEPAPEHTVTGNLGVFSQYIFRGLTQTAKKPALQGGFDYSHSSGFYAGTWGSNVSWLKENLTTAAGAISGTYGEGGSLELDFYGGYKGSLGGDFGFDVGTLYYWYPGAISTAAAVAALPNKTPKADTWEVYGALSWKWASAKLSYSIMNETFGTMDSKGTTYLDLSANVPLGDYFKDLTGFTLMAHWGWQKFTGTDRRNAGFAAAYGGRTPDNDTIYSYKDAKLGISYAMPKDFTVGAYWSKAYGSNVLGYGGFTQTVAAINGPYPSNIGKSTGTVYVQKTF